MMIIGWKNGDDRTAKIARQSIIESWKQSFGEKPYKEEAGVKDGVSFVRLHEVD